MGTAAVAFQALIVSIHLIIVWIHTSSTGYYLGYLIHTYWYKKPDEREFFKPLYPGQGFSYPIQSKDINLQNFIQELQQDSHPDCQHLIQYNPIDIQKYIKEGFKTDKDAIQGNHAPYHPHNLLKGATNEVCTIQIRGFLDDAQLISMINIQTNPIAKFAVAINGLYLQLKSLESNR